MNGPFLASTFYNIHTHLNRDKLKSPFVYSTIRNNRINVTASCLFASQGPPFGFKIRDKWVLASPFDLRYTQIWINFICVHLWTHGFRSTYDFRIILYFRHQVLITARFALWIVIKLSQTITTKLFYINICLSHHWISNRTLGVFHSKFTWEGQ